MIYEDLFEFKYKAATSTCLVLNPPSSQDTTIPDENFPLKPSAIP
jgi:hypothetical protein